MMGAITREQCIKPQTTTLPACTAGLSTCVPAVGRAMPGLDGLLMHLDGSELIQKMWLHLLGSAMLDLDLRPARRQPLTDNWQSLVGVPLTDRVKTLIDFARR